MTFNPSKYSILDLDSDNLSPDMIERIYRDVVYVALRSMSSPDIEERDDVSYWIGSPEFVSTIELARWRPEWAERLFLSVDGTPLDERRAVANKCIDMLKTLPSALEVVDLFCATDDLHSFHPGWTESMSNAGSAPDNYGKESNLRRMVRLKKEREERRRRDES